MKFEHILIYFFELKKFRKNNDQERTLYIHCNKDNFQYEIWTHINIHFSELKNFIKIS